MSAELPTEAGFYWWRQDDAKPWKLLRVRGSPGYKPTNVDELSGNAFFGRPLSHWAEDAPIGQWVRIQQPGEEGKR